MQKDAYGAASQVNVSHSTCKQQCIDSSIQIGAVVKYAAEVGYLGIFDDVADKPEIVN